MKKIFNAVGDRLLGDLNRVGGNGLTRLQQAIVDDDPARVSSLISLGADVNEPGLGSEPPLHRALSTNRISIARLLLNAGADVNLTDAKGQTALHKAVLQGNVTMVAQLLDSGADPNIADQDGRIALHLTPSGCDDCATLLARRGADVNRADVHGRRPLHYHLKHERMVSTLISFGADPNLDGTLPSPFAVALGTSLVATHPAAINALLRGGADINTPAENGERLLHVSARLGQAVLFRLALISGDLTLRDNDGNTVLHALMHLPQPDQLQTILGRVPELITVRNKTGDTPMQLLLTELAETPMSGADTYVNTLVSIARLFLQHGAETTAVGPRGTLLHEAVARSRHDLIDALAKHQADLNRPDRRGVAPLQLAVDMKRLDLVDRLLDLGADPDLTDDRGWTLLDRLAEKKDRDSPIVQRLIVAAGQYNKQLPLYPDLIRPRKASPAPANDDRAAAPPAKDAPARILKKPQPPGL